MSSDFSLSSVEVALSPLERFEEYLRTKGKRNTQPRRVIVEQIFALPGIGRITVQSALLRDYPVVMTTTLFVAILVITANLMVDFLYGVADPRIRLR